MCWRWENLDSSRWLVLLTQMPPQKGSLRRMKQQYSPWEDSPHDATEAEVNQANQDLDGLSGKPQTESLFLSLDSAPFYFNKSFVSSLKHNMEKI